MARACLYAHRRAHQTSTVPVVNPSNLVASARGGILDRCTAVAANTFIWLRRTAGHGGASGGADISATAILRLPDTRLTKQAVLHLGLNTVTGKPRPGSMVWYGMVWYGMRMDTPAHNDLQHLTKIAQDKPTWTQHLRQAFSCQQPPPAQPT